jgi:hypothetical protein
VVTAVQPQQIERVEMVWASAAHEIVELRPAMSKSNDLAVQQGIVGIQAHGERLA